MYTFVYFTLLVFQFLSHDKNNFHKKPQFCEGGTILEEDLWKYSPEGELEYCVIFVMKHKHPDPPDWCAYIGLIFQHITSHLWLLQVGVLF